jgi:hypothetical protein
MVPVYAVNRYMRKICIGSIILTSVLKGGDGFASFFGRLELVYL